MVWCEASGLRDGRAPSSPASALTSPLTLQVTFSSLLQFLPLFGERRHLLHRRVVKITHGNVYKVHGIVPRSPGSKRANSFLRTSCASSHGAWPAVCCEDCQDPCLYLSIWAQISN